MSEAQKIEIPAGKDVLEPIRLETQCVNTLVQREIRVGKDAKCMFIETVAGGGTCALEIFLDDGAECEFISVQTADASSKISIKQRSHLGANAKIQWRNITLGAHDVTHDLRSELIGADAISEVDWMFYAKDSEKYQLSVRNVFLGRHGGGEILMKGVAEEKGHVRCDGLIEIGPQGNQTDTYLTQEVLMLDKTSKVDAIPGLEIKTNDVKASHSATVSRVTEDDLFYFNTRGIEDREARRMFVEGFLGELVGKISDAKTREGIFGLIEKKYELPTLRL